MNNWITIISFTYPHEAHLAKTKLESEGLKVIILDELTAQVNNFYSNAIGGVKLQVTEDDYNKAYKILLEIGYIVEQVPSSNKSLMRLDEITSRIPIIGKSNLMLRLLILTALVLLMIFLPLAILSIPSMEEKLDDSSWCVDNFIFQGKQYQPKTNELKIVYRNGCYETVNFKADGELTLPGFNSRSVHANWEIRDKKVVIFNSDTLSYIYDGTYLLTFDKNLILLQSENTAVFGHYNGINW